MITMTDAVGAGAAASARRRRAPTSWVVCRGTGADGS